MNTETIKYLSQKEFRRLLKVIQKEKEREYPYVLRDLVMFNLAYYCGLRVSEVGMLTRECFNEQRNEVFCKRLKGSRANTIRLSDDKSKLLKKYIREYGIKDSSEPLFKSKRKTAISSRQLQKLMVQYCEKANISQEKRHFHVLKHSAAVHLAQSGLDIKEVQYWLGHKSVENTMVYFQFTSDQAEYMYQKLSKVSQMV